VHVPTVELVPPVSASAIYSMPSGPNARPRGSFNHVPNTEALVAGIASWARLATAIRDATKRKPNKRANDVRFFKVGLLLGLTARNRPNFALIPR
jgi:hypothetical protein